MPYVGNPLANAFSSRVKQDLTGQSGTSFTLTHAVSSANDLSVYINHVRQEPTTAYTVDYNTLTTTGSVAGTDDFYIIYDELGLQSIAHDSAQAMKATSGTFTGAITTTQMASSGPVSGTTGTFSGAISGTLGTAAQPNITSVGALNGLNVTTGSSGASANSVGDELVIQSSGRGGISILTPDANESNILFGSPSDNLGGFITYKQSTATMELGTSLASGVVKINSGDGSLNTTFNSDGRVGIGAAGESGVKLEVNAGLDGAVAISGRSDGGNGNNRRFNIIPFSSGGTYGGGFRLQTRNSSNVFHTAVEYINSQQEIFHGNYRTCDDKNKFGNGRYWYTGTESGTFSNAGNGVANAQTMTNYLNYQGMQIVCVKVYYSSDSALMHETFATVCNQYHNSGVATQHSHNGTGTIDSVSLSLTGGYNTRRLVVTLDPQASYPASNFIYAVYYGYNLN